MLAPFWSKPSPNGLHRPALGRTRAPCWPPSLHKSPTGSHRPTLPRTLPSAQHYVTMKAVAKAVEAVAGMSVGQVSWGLEDIPNPRGQSGGSRHHFLLSQVSGIPSPAHASSSPHPPLIKPWPTHLTASHPAPPFPLLSPLPSPPWRRRRQRALPRPPNEGGEVEWGGGMAVPGTNDTNILWVGPQGTQESSYSSKEGAGC